MDREGQAGAGFEPSRLGCTHKAHHVLGCQHILCFKLIRAIKHIMSDKKDQRIPVLMSAVEVEQVDQWRAKQAGLPNRSEAIRRLIQAGLQAK